MTNSEIKALLSLLDDEDVEVISHVSEKITSLGVKIIPHLETEWEESFNPTKQKRIENIIHSLQFNSLKQKLALWAKSEEQNILEGAYLIATYQYPDFSIEDVKKDIEQMYYDIWLSLDSNLHPLDQVKKLNIGIFQKLKFSANTKNFHSPSNSMINIVLENKKGNPISLCIIYLLIAQKLNMPIYGVNLPNLFVLTYKDEQNQFYINVFNKGLIFSKADIDTYIQQLNLKSRESFYEPCTNLDIVRRILRNLINSFEKLGDLEKVAEIRELFNSIK